MASDGQQAAAHKILVADDDPEIRRLLVRRLQARGFDVIEAGDGASALEMATEQRPDLVILDVMMPEKNGWEVARALRSNDELASLRILMLTAIGPKVNEMTSPLYGADDYLDKPFEFSVLDSKIATLLAIE